MSIGETETSATVLTCALTYILPSYGPQTACYVQITTICIYQYHVLSIISHDANNT